MRHFTLLPLLGLLLLAGCARHYVVTLTNGGRISAFGKPRLEDGKYVFKDATGQSVSLPASRVREIAPASMSEEPAPILKPYVVK